MRSTFGGLEISKRSLFTHQTSLNTTAHNMANANTKGYSRQVVNHVASRPMEAVGMMRSNAPGQIGTGVEYDSIVRMRETFLDDQYYNENKGYGDWKVRYDTLSKLEAILNEPSETGIRTVLSNFWNAWQEFSKHPESMTSRTVVKESALALTDAFNHTAKQLEDLKRDLTDGIQLKVVEMNTLIEQIAQYNEQIYRVEGFGNNANDLRDQRDLLVDQLSGLVNIHVVEGPNGYVITMGNAELVNGYAFNNTWTEETLIQSVASGDLDSGYMHGLIISRDGYVKEYEEKLNVMVRAMAIGEITVELPAGAVVPEGTVIDGVTYTGSVEDRTLTEPKLITVNGMNGLHSLGYYEMAGTVERGGPIFVTKDGSSQLTAANITVDVSIQNNIERLAASMRVFMNEDGGLSVVNGNNDLALLMANLRLTPFQFDSVAGSEALAMDKGTMDEYFRALVGAAGVQTQEAERRSLNQAILVEQIDSRRMSVSGVSLDEEMANMIRFQHGYNAAARAMTTFDEMLDRIINGMGRVGL